MSRAVNTWEQCGSSQEDNHAHPRLPMKFQHIMIHLHTTFSIRHSIQLPPEAWAGEFQLEFLLGVECNPIHFSSWIWLISEMQSFHFIIFMSVFKVQRFRIRSESEEVIYYFKHREGIQNPFQCFYSFYIENSIKLISNYNKSLEHAFQTNFLAFYLYAYAIPSQTSNAFEISRWLSTSSLWSCHDETSSRTLPRESIRHRTTSTELWWVPASDLWWQCFFGQSEAADSGVGSTTTTTNEGSFWKWCQWNERRNSVVKSNTSTCYIRLDIVERQSKSNNTSARQFSTLKAAGVDWTCSGAWRSTEKRGRSGSCCNSERHHKWPAVSIALVVVVRAL